VERRLDLAQLDAVPAALDLGVGAAQVMEQAVGSAARQIAGLVDAVLRTGSAGIGEKRGESLSGSRQ